MRVVIISIRLCLLWRLMSVSVHKIVCVVVDRFCPYVGMVTIIMNDYPYVKYLLIGILGLLVLTSKE